MNDEKLRKLQLIQLYILLELKRICEKHNINYFLTGGTLLGAVRHKGFIPWDDDIDVAMLRKDYDKFIALCPNELNKCFHLVSIDIDKSYPLLSSKLVLNNTKIVEKHELKTGVQDGIYIDIMSYDNIPSDFRAIIQYNINLILHGIYAIKHKYSLVNQEKSLKKKYGIKICKILSLFISNGHIVDLLMYNNQRYNKKESKYAMCFNGACYSFDRECQRKEVVSKYTNMPFEGYMFSVPINYDEFLRTLYGSDYMILPPVEKRTQHQIVELDFGKYDDIDCYLKSISENM